MTISVRYSLNYIKYHRSLSRVSIFAPYRYFFHFPKRPPPPALRSFICRPFCAFENPACNTRAPCLRGRARRAPRRFVFPPKSTKDTASCHRWREAKCISLCIESLCPVASLGWISRTPRRILDGSCALTQRRAAPAVRQDAAEGVTALDFHSWRILLSGRTVRRR